MNIHSKNINISKIVEKLGDKLSFEDFFNFMKFIYREINEEEINELFKYLQREDKSVHIHDFTNFLAKYQCRLTGLVFSKQEKEMEVEEDNVSNHHLGETFHAIERLKDVIEKKNLDVCKWMKGLGIAKDQVLDVQSFGKLLAQINHDITLEEVKLIFREFDTKKEGNMTFDQAFKSICKIAEIVPMDDE